MCPGKRADRAESTAIPGLAVITMIPYGARALAGAPVVGWSLCLIPLPWMLP